jgi:predicted nucleic acid-binding protein
VKNVLDAGPLIAALNTRDTHHRWAKETLNQLGPPFYSCAVAMAEAAAMTGKPAAIVEMIKADEIVLDFDLSAQTAGVLALLKKYQDRNMDLADACIVRMSELHRDCQVITVDRDDFAIYRRNGRDFIPVIAPPAPVKRGGRVRKSG